MSTPAPRSPLSVGLDWAGRATSVGLQFALPPLGGLAVDRWLGSAPWGVLIGAAVGFAAGIAALLRLARASGDLRSTPRGG